jgi:UDP-N-acetylglucosamine 2-epimerase
MVRIDLIAGARPNFIKIASIIRGIKSRQRVGSSLCYRLVHTGQHYDARMSGDFFDQLGIPEPGVNLEAGSGTQAGALFRPQAVEAARKLQESRERSRVLFPCRMAWRAS